MCMQVATLAKATKEERQCGTTLVGSPWVYERLLLLDRIWRNSWLSNWCLGKRAACSVLGATFFKLPQDANSVMNYDENYCLFFKKEPVVLCIHHPLYIHPCCALFLRPSAAASTCWTASISLGSSGTPKFATWSCKKHSSARKVGRSTQNKDKPCRDAIHRLAKTGKQCRTKRWCFMRKGTYPRWCQDSTGLNNYPLQWESSCIWAWHCRPSMGMRQWWIFLLDTWLYSNCRSHKNHHPMLKHKPAKNSWHLNLCKPSHPSWARQISTWIPDIIVNNAEAKAQLP